MKNIFIIPTEPNDETGKGVWVSSRRDWCNIYITVNEEIKEGVNQWYLDLFLNKPYQSSGAQYNSKQEIIILTTDPILIADGVQAIDDSFLEWFVNNYSCEFVEVGKFKLCIQTGSPCGMQCFSEETCNENIIYKIIIPQKEHKRKIDTCHNFDIEIGCTQTDCRCEDEEPKCQCIRPDDNTCDYCDDKESKDILEEAAKEYSQGWGENDDVKSFIAGGKYVAERMYSEEEVIELLTARCKHFGTTMTPFRELLLKQDLEWFEENKKK
jgi:hypothetical protein